MQREEFSKKITELLAGLPGKTAVAAKDLTDGESFAWRDTELFTPASTIKLPILCAAYDAARRGLVSLEQRIPVKAIDRVGGNGVLFEFAEGLMPTLHDLMTLMIVISDNMATNLVMDAVGTGEIRSFLESRDLGEIRAERRMLDPEGMRRGLVNCVTAKSLARLLEGLVNETLLEPEDCQDAVSILLRQQCNNKMPVEVIDRWDLIFQRSDIKIAHKTGDMPGIEHDAGLVFLPNTTFVLVCLTENVENEAAIRLISRITKEFTDYFGQKEVGI